MRSAGPDRYDHPSAWDMPLPPRMLHEMLLEKAGQQPDARFLHFMGRDFSYGEIAAAVRALAAGLSANGVGDGCRVGLFLPNTPHYVIAYYAILMAGGTVVNFSPLYSEDELVFQIEDSGTEIMVTLDLEQLFPMIDKVMHRTGLKRIVAGNIAEMLPPVKARLYRLLKGRDRADVDYSPRVIRFGDLCGYGAYEAAGGRDPATEVALIQYTGGTTGRPKGAELTHANLSVNAQQVQAIDPGLGGNNSILGGLPLFHVFANTCVLNRTVVAGGWMVMLPRFDVKDALQAIETHRIAAFPGVPAMYRGMLDHPKLSSFDLTSLTVCISGGAPMPTELREEFVSVTGAKLVEGYGLTESSGVVSCNPYEGGGKRGSIGQPVPGTSIVIVDQDDPTKVLGTGEKGEITVEGPQILKRYHNRPDANETTFVDGRLRTGDVGYVDADGYAFIVDRMKDLILVGGFNVYPSAIEEVLYRQPAVKEAIVIGVPDSRVGERPKGFVTLKAGEAVDAETLREAVNREVGKHERMVALEIRDELPKTMIGKLSRKELVAEERARTG